MGYTTKSTENFEFIGPAFAKIGEDQSFTLKDIDVNCAETEAESGTGWQALGDGIIMLNENGTFVRRLVYLPSYLATALAAETGTPTKEGWYDDEKVSEDDYSASWDDEPLTFGYAVQVCANTGFGAGALWAGQVKDSPTVVDVENFMSVANCSPTTLKLSDLIVNCSETEDGNGTGWQALGDGIIMLNENGTFVRRLVYLPSYLATAIATETGNPTEAGWYDDADVAENNFSTRWDDTVTFAAGGGFQVAVAAGMGATVSVKSALAE